MRALKRYAKTLECLAKDKDNDGILAILSPQDVTDPTLTAELLRTFAHLPEKPILASWMGGSSVAKGSEILAHAQIPTFEYPDDAALTFATMWRYSKNLRILYQTPIVEEAAFVSASDAEQQVKREAIEIISVARKDGREILDEFESKKC